MSTKFPFYIILLSALALALAACVPTDTPTPTLAIPAGQEDTAATIVAATVNAALNITQAAPEATQPAVEATLPPAPTDTSAAAPTEPPPPTDTPAPTAVPPSPTPTLLPALRIAYVKDGNVYLWTEGVGSVGLTNTHDANEVRISPDGAMIAYRRQDPNNSFFQELWVVNTAGPVNARTLVSQADLTALKPADASGMGINRFAWRPGTHEVAYSTQPLFEGPGSAPNHDLRLVNADSLAKSTLFDKDQGGIFYYSPDGSQIALSNPDHISLVNADGSNLRPNVLTFPLVGTYSEYQYHPHPIWAADSSSLRVTIPPADTLASPLPPTGLWRINTDGSPSVLLGNVQAMPFAWPDNAFAPDFAHVIYAMQVGVPTDNIRELRVANPDGSNDTRYDSGESLEFIGWAPSSQRFFYKISSGARKGIYLGTVEAMAITLTNDPSSIIGLTWVDAERFAHFTRNGNFWELRITHPAGNGDAFIDTVPDGYPALDVLAP